PRSAGRPRCAGWWTARTRGSRGPCCRRVSRRTGRVDDPPMTAVDHTLATRVVLRVLDDAGEPVGAGFLLGPDGVATWAHVVADANGADPYAAAPPDRAVRLDFPLLGDRAGRTARVVRWLPIADDGSGDIAVLQLDGSAPRGARMPPLRRVDALWDHPFR